MLTLVQALELDSLGARLPFRAARPEVFLNSPMALVALTSPVPGFMSPRGCFGRSCLASVILPVRFPFALSLCHHT